MRVDEYMAVETYAHVHHIVSNVTGELRAGVTPGEALRAVFPGGTITGCPRVRCMQIIAELEGGPRGPYTGSLGYLNRDGYWRLQHPDPHHRSLHGNELEFRAGAGIVADSDPQRELEETRAKARGMAAGAGFDERTAETTGGWRSPLPHQLAAGSRPAVRRWACSRPCWPETAGSASKPCTAHVSNKAMPAPRASTRTRPAIWEMRASRQADSGEARAAGWSLPAA